MKKLFIEELKDGDVVDCVFLVRDKNVTTTKDGRPFINLNLIDRTGKVSAKIWDRPMEAGYIKDVSGGFNKNDFVKIRGRVETYKDITQIIVDGISRVESGEVDITDFVPKGEVNPDEIVKELIKVIGKIKDPHIKRLLSAFLKDNDFMDKFKTAPAAKKLHQAYVGGLIDHTMNLVRMVIDIAAYYPVVNRDLLVAGAILHDIGKIEELDYERSFDYSDRGRLLGHIFIGAMMVREKIQALKDFPSEIEALILHMILSHHGSFEFGSPILPVIPEALILHYIDDMDAKVWGFMTERAKSEDVEGNWTKFSKVFDRFIYKGDTFFGQSEDEGKKKMGRAKTMYDLFDDE
jgi:3'-5' exoribonuclease